MTGEIGEEFVTIASGALRKHPGSDSVTVAGIVPSAHGPLVQWSGPLLARERVRKQLEGGGWSLGPPAGPLLLDLLARTVALRWRDGYPRRLAGWEQRLAKRYRRIWGGDAPETGVGWSWLWEAGASMVEEKGVPRKFRTTQTKEKFGSLRWYTEAAEPSEYVDELADAMEHLSAYICEDCGAPGWLRQGGWIKALCQTHAGGRRCAGG